MDSLLAIFLGGGLGSVARYLVATGMERWFPSAFPWGTLTVNVVGSFLIGLIFGLATRPFTALPYQWNLFLSVGFCGGFTTFSAFSLGVVSLFRNNQTSLGLAYILASVLLSVAAFWAATALERTWR